MKFSNLKYKIKSSKAGDYVWLLTTKAIVQVVRFDFNSVIVKFPTLSGFYHIEKDTYCNREIK